jgi:seryl-tRNA synthetase
MLDIKYIREHVDEIKQNIKNRGLNVDIDELLKLDKSRLELLSEVEKLRNTKNKPSTKPTATELVELKKIKNKEDKLSTELDNIEVSYQALLFAVPNITHPDSPIGKDDSENVEIRKAGKVPKFDFTPLDHVELGEKLNIIDFEAGSKVTGAKFYFLKDDAVLLEQALINYGLKILRDEGFTLVATPDVAKTELVNNMGYQPRGPEAQIYNIEGNDLSLIGTAEIALGGLYAGEIIDEKKLPITLAGLSHCFRTEAGAYGRHSKGLYRVHQFSKLEMFVFCKPEDSDKWHEKLVKLEERIFAGLEIPYRVVDICTGDMGAVAYRKYDLEGWMPGRNDYGEITSTSNCRDYQARNLGIKYRKSGGTTEYLHMLNGTGIAISRALIVLLENYQQADGSIKIPKVLQEFVGKSVIKQREEK